MRTIIITDSGADIPNQGADELRIVPMKITFDGEEFVDGVDLTHQMFYEKLAQGGKLPTTSQPSPYDFEKVFEEVAARGDQALVITISQKLSGTHQSAVLAERKHAGHVVIVDSENVSVGLRILVERAQGLLAAGMDARAAAQQLERDKKRICLLARLDTLEYLKAGGRISKTAAFAGGLLGIKPVVSVLDGEVKVIGKARGSKNGNNLLRERIMEVGGVDFAMPIALGYTGLSDEALKRYVVDSADIWQGQASELPVATIGGTIGTHAGPGAIAVAFFAKGK